MSIINREALMFSLIFSDETGNIPCEQMKKVLKVVKAQPPMQTEQRWIPCAPETMPENTDEVFVTYTVNGKKQRYVETATWYDGDEGYWSSPWDEYRVPGTKVEVIAWMPLPKPYKGGEHG